MNVDLCFGIRKNAESQFSKENLRLKIEIPKPSELNLTEEQSKRFLKFIYGDDLNFYVEYLMDLTDEQQEIFFEENPDFMSEFPINHDNMDLLKDKMFRGILRKIKRYEEGMNNGN